MIEEIKEAIRKADDMQSKLHGAAYEVPALASLKIRHLLNNLGALSQHYLECGVHKGGTFCSSVFLNNLKSATAIDSWESDHMNGEVAEKQFRINSNLFASRTTELNIIKSDCFATDLKQIKHPIDFYLYDAGHSYDDQRQALTYFYPVLADEFILCVDDYDLLEVQKGTQDGILQAGLNIMFDAYLVGNDHDNDGWWRGYYCALLKKK